MAYIEENLFKFGPPKMEKKIYGKILNYMYDLAKHVQGLPQYPPQYLFQPGVLWEQERLLSAIQQAVIRQYPSMISDYKSKGWKLKNVQFCYCLCQ